MPFTLCGRDRLPCVLRAPFCVRAKHLVRELFLLVGHRIVQVLESRNEVLQVPGVCVSDLLVRFHVLNSVHRLELLRALHEGLVHVAGVLAHHRGELIPLLLLGRGYAQLRVQFADAVLDALRGGRAGHRVSGDR